MSTENILGTPAMHFPDHSPEGNLSRHCKHQLETSIEKFCVRCCQISNPQRRHSSQGFYQGLTACCAPWEIPGEPPPCFIYLFIFLTHLILLSAFNISLLRLSTLNRRPTDTPLFSPRLWVPRDFPQCVLPGSPRCRDDFALYDLKSPLCGCWFLKCGVVHLIITSSLF